MSAASLAWKLRGIVALLGRSRSLLGEGEQKVSRVREGRHRQGRGSAVACSPWSHKIGWRGWEGVREWCASMHCSPLQTPAAALKAVSSSMVGWAGWTPLRPVTLQGSLHALLSSKHWYSIPAQKSGNLVVDWTAEIGEGLCTLLPRARWAERRLCWEAECKKVSH